MNLFEKFNTLVIQTFVNNILFEGALDRALRSVVNDSFNKSLNASELIAKYCDALMKKSSKSNASSSDSDSEQKLNKAILLFKYIDDKDVFQKFYSRLLAKRLIYAQSTSLETEANVISRLKETCGVEYTSKLQRMFTDMRLSEELTKEFVQKNNLAIHTNALILTSGSWPFT